MSSASRRRLLQVTTGIVWVCDPHPKHTIGAAFANTFASKDNQ
jgi:hypothetical protein